MPLGSIGNTGNIKINTSSLILLNNAQINTTLFQQTIGKAGDIEINASESIQLDGQSSISSANLFTDAVGDTGKIAINTDNLMIAGNSLLSTSVTGLGNVNNINITANILSLANNAQITTNNFGVGNAGNIEIFSNQVALDGSQVTANNLSLGDAGQVKIQASESVTLSRSSSVASVINTGVAGNAGNVEIAAGNVSIDGQSSLLVSNLGVGNAGNIKIDANAISITNNSQLGASNTGQGNAGNIIINASNGLIAVINSSILSDGLLGGNISLNSQNSISASGSLIRSSNSTSIPDLKGGDINITASSLSLNNGTIVGTTTTRRANAGDIVVNATDTVTLNNLSSLFSGVAPGAEGNTGAITLNADSLFLTNGGQITTVVSRASQLPDGRIIPAGQGNTGNITIRARDITIDGVFSAPVNPTKSLIQSIIDRGATGTAGNIDIQATNSLTLSNGAGIGSILNNNAIGGSGDINIKAGSLSISNGSAISNSIFGIGDAGNIKIEVRDAFSADGANGIVPSGIQSNIESGGVGNAGNIDIESGSLSLTNGAQLQTSIRGEIIILQNNELPPIIQPPGQGQAGNISLNIRDTLTIDGFKPVTFNGVEQKLASSIFSTLELGAIGGGGDINIKAGSLSLTNNTGIASSTFGTGNAGNIKVEVSNAAILDSNSAIQSNVESGGIGNAGTIEVTADLLSLTGISQIDTFVRGASPTPNRTIPAGQGNGGNVSIKAREIIFDGIISDQSGNTLSSGIVSQVSPGAMGIAGNVNIEATDSFLLRNGAIVTSQLGFNAIGRSGDINITTGSLSLLSGSNIAASTRGQGNSGNIRIEASGTVTIDGAIFSPQFFNSKIISSVESGGVGNAGTIELSAGSLSLINGGQISTFVRRASEISGGIIAPAGRGNGGNIIINAREIILDGFTVDQFNRPFVSAIGSNIDEGATGTAGNIEIRAINSFTLSNGSGITSALSFNAIGRGGDITIQAESLSLTNNTQINANTSGQGNAGDILIKDANSITVNGGSQIRTDTFGQGNAGNVTIDAPNAVITFEGFSFFNNRLTPSGIVTVVQPVEGLINARTGGNINVTAKSLSLTNGAQVNALTAGRGNAGNVTVNIRDGIVLTGDSSGIITRVNPGAIGKGGDITLTAGSLSLSNGATIASDTFGIGDAGNINLDVRGLIELRDFVTFPLDDVILPVQTSIATGVQGAVGNAGSITIKAQSLSLDNFSLITTATLGTGNAANISIQVDDSLTLTRLSTIESIVGAGAIGNSGDIDIQARSIILTDGSQIETQLSRASNNLAGGQGKAGDIRINATDSISISGVSKVQLPITMPTDGFSSGLFASTEKGANGLGGTITVTTNTFRVADGAVVNAFTANSGRAGDITINANTFEATGGGQVLTTTRSSGNAGNITLNITDNILLSGSDLTFADRFDRFGEDVVNNQGAESGLFVNTTGQGIAGNIIINTPIFNIDESAVVSAKTDNAGDGGNITIIAPNSVTLGNNSQLTVETSNAGRAGDITITSDTITIGKDAQLSATATATATNTEGGGSITLNTSNLNISGKLGIFAETQSNSPAGNLTLQPNNNNLNLNIRFTGNGFISARAFNTGEGGDITISAPQAIDIRGNGQITVEASGSGNAGDINITTKILTLGDGLEISASTIGSGSAGSINLNANQINLSQTQINAFTDSTGNAGSITLSNQGNNANLVTLSDDSRISTEIRENGQANTPSNITLKTDNLTLDNSTITASTSGKGDAGSITVPNAQNITLNQSEITASTSGEGNTGIITLNATENIELSNNSTISNAVNVGGIGNAREITLDTPILTLINSNITASTSGKGDAGSITIPNAQNITLDNSTISTAIETGGIATDSSDIELNTQQLSLNNAQITASTSGKGDAGSITIPNAQNITLNQSEITASTSGEGDTGIITLNANENIELNNSQISSSVEPGAVGDSQTITLNTPIFTLNNNSLLSATTAGQGNAGSILIPNTQTLTLDNSTISTVIETGGIATEPSNITLNTRQLNLNNTSQITATTSGEGDAGKITITGDSLTLNDGATIQTNTTSSGKAGDIVFNLNNNLNLTNSTIEASTDRNSTGDGGNITIDPITVTLTDNARISVNSQGQGDGGNILVTAQNLSLNNRSEISAITASGEGGNITLNVPNTLLLRNNSPISATAGGTGNGGNITINTEFLITSENSDITANAFEGTGGNIRITTNGIFSDLNSEITASSERGIDGVIETNTPEVDPSRGLINFPINIIDPNALIAQNACKKGGRSEFTVSGRGGLPSSPEQVQGSNETEVGLVEMTETSANTVTPNHNNTAKKIVPAQGWVRNEKGELVLVADSNTSNQRQVNSPVGCQAP